MLDTTDFNQLTRYLDHDGRLTAWPRKHAPRAIVLRYLASKFADGDYDEDEVNALLRRWHTFNDPCLLRRALFVEHLINRTPDGRRYWVKPRDLNTTLLAILSLLPDVEATLTYARHLRTPVPEVVADYLTAHIGAWRRPSAEHPPRATSLMGTLTDPRIDAFLTAVDTIMNSNTLLLMAKVQPL